MPGLHKTRYAVDVRDVRREVDRVGDLPNLPAIVKFEAILERLFAETQFVVHVETGSLRASGEHKAWYHNRKWHGRISYGGMSHGMPNDPVKYAEFERERGGAHNFMRPIAHADNYYFRAIRDALGGDE